MRILILLFKVFVLAFSPIFANAKTTLPLSQTALPLGLDAVITVLGYKKGIPPNNLHKVHPHGWLEDDCPKWRGYQRYFQQDGTTPFQGGIPRIINLDEQLSLALWKTTDLGGGKIISLAPIVLSSPKINML